MRFPVFSIYRASRATLVFLLGFLLSFTFLSVRAEDAETKRAELVRLVHYTGELKDFRDEVAGTISRLKESKREMPLWFWSALEKEVNADEYLQWVINEFYLALSEPDVRQLNAIFGAPEKKAVFEELGRLYAETPKQDIPAKVGEFRQTRSRELIDEIINFTRSDAFAKYEEVLKTKDAARREEAIKLMVEADRRIRAREARVEHKED